MRIGAAKILSCTCALVFVAHASACCFPPTLANQHHDAATIRKLERAWTVAFLGGDTEFEKCLLTSDFTQIMSNGNVIHLSDELALAENNKGKVVADPAMPDISVFMHGNVAVAYGVLPEKLIDSRPHQSLWADFYLWRSGAWHVYFAQQTSFEVKPNAGLP